MLRLQGDGGLILGTRSMKRLPSNGVKSITSVLQSSTLSAIIRQGSKDGQEKIEMEELV